MSRVLAPEGTAKKTPKRSFEVWTQPKDFITLDSHHLDATMAPVFKADSDDGRSLRSPVTHMGPAF